MDRLRGGGRLTAQQNSKRAWVQLGTWVILGVLVVSAGYLVFRLFAGGQLPGATQLYLLAIIAGVASFFSPCAFPLVPTYVSFYYVAHQRDHGGAAPWLRLGGASALGVLAFNLLLGLAIAVFGAALARSFAITADEPSQFVLALRVLVGIALIILGYGQLRGWNLKPGIADRFVYAMQPQRGSARGPGASLFIYGFGYTAAGLGCTGPILAGLIVGALASSGTGFALGAFLVFAATMAILMLLISGMVGASRETLITRLKSRTPAVQKVASVLLILVGAFNILSSVYLSQFQSLLFPA